MSVMNKWAVLECPNCKRRTYWYLGYEHQELDGEERLRATEFEEGYSSNCYICDSRNTIVPYEDWSAKDIAEIFGNELEDKNYHSLVNMPQTLLDSLNEGNIEPEKCTQIMKNFMEKMTKSWR